MNTDVVYKYRAPGSNPDQDDKIKTQVISYEPSMVLKLIQAEGQTLSLWSDYREKYGGQPKDYKVVERYIEPGTTNILNVIVTDPQPRESNLSAHGQRDTNNPPDRKNSTEHPWWEPPEDPVSVFEDWGNSTGREAQEPQERRSWWRRLFEV